MRVLLTGASGFIGSNILKDMLAKTEWEFVCLSSWRHHGDPMRLQGMPRSRVTIITHDLRHPIPDLGDFDYILNLASESHVDRANADPVNFIENNISVMLQMLEYARKHTPRVFLQFSTDEVYGDNEHGEWDLLLPSGPYGASKACQEVICIGEWRTYNLPIVLTNSNNIVGSNQDPEKFVPKIVQIIKDGGVVPIHTINGKPAIRHWNPVENVSAAIRYILKMKPALYSDGAARLDRYGIPGGEELNILEMAQLVADILGKPLRANMVDGGSVRPGIDKDYPRTDGRLTELGFKPPVSLREGLSWIK